MKNEVVNPIGLKQVIDKINSLPLEKARAYYNRLSAFEKMLIKEFYANK